MLDGENGWTKILAVASILSGPAIVIITDLRASSSDHARSIGQQAQELVAARAFQSVVATQQWCDGVIRELERDAAQKERYYSAQCPSVVPPVGTYHPPTAPWGLAAPAVGGQP